MNCFDLEQKKITKSTTYPDGEALLYRCVTSYNQYIFVIGGWRQAHYYSHSTRFYIYNRNTGNWSRGADLSDGRIRHSCNVVNDTVYVMGGCGPSCVSAIDTVEYLKWIDSFDCCGGRWMYMSEGLSPGRYDHRSIVFQENIYVIGGDIQMNIIDTISKTISAPLSSKLPFQEECIQTIVVENVIYIFKGSHYQYLRIPIRSDSPTFAPTNTPSVSPSTAPTIPPTNYPIRLNTFDKQIDITYEIKNLYSDNIEQIRSTIDIKEDIIPIIEWSYVNFLLVDHYLQYRNFEVLVNTFYYQEQTKQLQKMIIISVIKYYNNSVVDDILRISQSNSFKNKTKYVLRNMYQNNIVEFDAHAQIFTSSNKEPINYTFYATLALMPLMAIFSLLAIIYNKKEGTRTDDGDWKILILLAIHIGDFVSDILVSTEILSQFDQTNNFEQNLLWLHIAGIGSVLFIIIPYCINVYILWTFDTFIYNNKSAIIHFQQYRVIFIMVMLLTGSAYISVLLLSSKVFAIDLFCSGLTRYELGKLSKLKMMGGVISENVPQLIILAIYAAYKAENPSSVFIMSCVSSFLSIVAALLSYFMGTRTGNYVVVEYELKLITKNRQRLTDDDIYKISQKKECTKSLGKHLCIALNLNYGVVQFGKVVIVNNGFSINMVQYTFGEDLLNKRFEMFVTELYDNHKQQVDQVFSSHFQIAVEYHLNFVDGSQKEIQMENPYNYAPLDA
eukprot:498995_1